MLATVSNTNTNTNTNTNLNTNTNTNTNANASAGSNFIAFEVSLELIGALAPLVPIVERNDRELGDQIRRAANSVSLNLGEGQRSAKGNRQKHYAIAHGSANEVKAALLVAQAWGWIERSDRALAIMDRLLALLWKLTHRTS